MKKIFAVMALVGLSSPVLAQVEQAPSEGVATSSEVAGTSGAGYSTVTIASTVVAAVATAAVLYSVGGDSTSGPSDGGG
uniref:hypothetical protein n=1 Tax=Stenotrophomonas sp. TaxID=69392 RepID=UPI0028B04286